jgi:hypothetical protein
MSLKTWVLHVLNGPAVARIRFRFPIRGSHVTITPQTFHHVAHAIVSGRVTVQSPTNLASDRAAQYVARANRLEVKSVAGRLNEAYLVHESLHAAYDLLRTGIDANAEEASAYVCSALHLRMTGFDRAGRVDHHQIWGPAARVAQTLLSQYQKGDPGIPMVGEQEWQTLRAGVGLFPLYAALPSGIFTGWVLGRQYDHDG